VGDARAQEGGIMTLMQVSNITKSYGGVAAVSDVSFQLAAGEILALIGPNGAGKSTCFNMLNGQIRPDTGDISIDDVSTIGLAPREVWRRGVGRTFQIAATFGSMTVAENVQMVLLSHHRLLGKLWGFAGAQYRKEAERLLDLVGMLASANRASAELAYGDVKRLELAIALANKPKLLLMDEPTAGMAPGERIALMQLTADIARAERIGVLFTEHDMDVVFEHASRVMVLSRGRLIAEGSPQQVRDDGQVRAIYLGDGLTYEARHQSEAEG
jgi:branched-chain amino acid transport system ATP-binding protein